MFKHGTKVLRSCLLSCSFLLLGAVWHTLEACTDPPVIEPTVIIERHSDTEVWLTICDYTTFGATGNNICVCALDIGDGVVITEVKDFSITSTLSNIVPPIEDVFDFAENSAVADAVDLISQGDWSGFFAEVDQLVQSNIPIKLMFELCIDAGTSNADLLDAVKNVRILTDEGNSALEPTGGHQHIEDLETIDESNIELVDDRPTSVAEHFRDDGLPVIQPMPIQPGKVAQLSFTLKQHADVNIGLFNSLGHRVQILAAGERAAGLHTIPINSSMLASGTYFVRLLVNQELDLTRTLSIIR